MTTAADDIALHLQTAGEGTIGASTGWSISTNREPSSPNTTITIYDTPGPGADPKFSRDFPRFQVRVRGGPNGIVAARDKALSIKAELLGRPQITLNGNLFVGIWNSIDVYLLHHDDNNRPVFVSTWRAVREPPVSGYRQ